MSRWSASTWTLTCSSLKQAPLPQPSKKPAKSKTQYGSLTPPIINGTKVSVKMIILIVKTRWGVKCRRMRGTDSLPPKLAKALGICVAPPINADVPSKPWAHIGLYVKKATNAPQISTNKTKSTTNGAFLNRRPGITGSTARRSTMVKLPNTMSAPTITIATIHNDTMPISSIPPSKLMIPTAINNAPARSIGCKLCSRLGSW